MQEQALNPTVSPSAQPRPQGAGGAKASRWADQAFRMTTAAFAIFIAGLVILILIEMAQNSTLTFARFGFSFITAQVWDPVREEFGALPFVYGTTVSSLIALVIA